MNITITQAPPAVQATEAAIIRIEHEAGFPVMRETVWTAPPSAIIAGAGAGAQSFETATGPIVSTRWAHPHTPQLVIILAHEALHQFHAHDGYETDDPWQQGIEEGVTQRNAMFIAADYWAQRHIRGVDPNPLNSYSDEASYVCAFAGIQTLSFDCTTHRARAWLRNLQFASPDQRDLMMEGK